MRDDDYFICGHNSFYVYFINERKGREGTVEYLANIIQWVSNRVKFKASVL